MPLVPAGKARSDERVEGDDVAAGGREQLLGLGVAEREGPPARDRDHGASRPRGRHLDRGVPRRRVELGRRPGDREQRVEVEVAGHLLAEPSDHRDRVVALGGGHEPEVSRRRGQVLVARQHPQHGQRQRPPDLLDVALGSRPVEDDAGDPDPWVVRRHAGRDRRDRPRLAGDVEDEHDR